jgi:hypothetical protein
VERRGHGGLHRRARDPGEPAGRGGLPVDRLRAVHGQPLPGADPRSGRWAGTGKIECGLHVQ